MVPKPGSNINIDYPKGTLENTRVPLTNEPLTNVISLTSKFLHYSILYQIVRELI
ncbi:hypothetical protein DAPPUDRAFT_326374 [Daphnia pulex]|uniref:Uncharacterized protein n=1 Tax=Daphnia pulex TaxID=6669 RepID=E9H7J0_DAPPU|nr:hypothetical protein DAPPUDRAFT_326374 [Daphnia pulex]|eukprot:EFX72195.1 hypothetical protein DAPPUDRAFT_326374 [Daphnia pulex]